METTCTTCAMVTPDGARFCPSCGTVVDDRPRCACGTPIAPDARFCSGCGLTTETSADLQAEPQAERRTVTVLFADAVGSTAFAERAGDEAAYRLVQDCVAIMSAAVERHGGTITQFRGDGVMALFGAPVAYEDSAVRAASAALELRDSLAALATTSGCSFRIGLSTGPVVVGRVGDDVLMDYTAIGDTANVAARMESAAEPGTVLLSEPTWRAVRQYVECTSVGALDVKGKSAPIPAYEAVRRRSIRTRIEAAVERGLGPFVGRGSVLDGLLGHVDALSSGRGHVVEVSGEAGIGKSRLLLELRSRVPDDVGWIVGHCAPSGGATPYLPIADLLRNAFGVEEDDDAEAIEARIDRASASLSADAGAALPYLKYLLDIDPGTDALPTEARTRRAGILAALRVSVADAATRQPRVLVVEDVHWADEASLEALDALADIAETSPILLLVTSRPGARSPFERRSSHSRVALDGISADEAAEVAASVFGVDHIAEELTRLVAERADGNPLFVEELAATLAETGLVVETGGNVRLARPAEFIDVPDTLQEVILARIDRLAREARDALQLAAVIGREFTVRLLDRLAGMPNGLDVALDELKSVELIRQKAWFPELAYLFKHALTHEVTYATLLDERRRSLHRLVAQAIEDVYGDRLAEHVETLAHHWSIAEDWPRALDYLERAADDAAATFASEVAIDFYEQAIAIAERLGDLPRTLSLLSRDGDALMAAGKLAEAAELFERMAARARIAHDPEALAWALAYRGQCLAYAHDVRRGEPCLVAAVATDGAGAAPRLYAAVCLKLVSTIFGYHDRDSSEVDAVIEELEVEGIDNPRTVAWIQSFGGTAPRWQGDLRRCLEILGPEPPSAGDLLATQATYWVRGLAQTEAGRFDEGLATLASAHARSVTCNETFFRARLINSIGWVRLELGDLAGAIEWNERCIAFLLEVDLPDEEIESNARLNLTEAHLATGRLDRAAAELERVEAITRGQPIRGTWLLWRFSQRRLLLESRLRLAQGEAAPDGRIADAVALAEESSSVKYLAKAARLRGDWALASGSLDVAEHEARLALDIATRMGHPAEQWRSLALLADIATGRGDVELAHEHRRGADALLAAAEDSVQDAAAKAGVASLRAALL